MCRVDKPGNLRVKANATPNMKKMARCVRPIEPKYVR